MQETDNQKDKLWMSLEQYNNDPKFREMAETEFMSSPLREEGEVGRREFLKLMGASFALASSACIRRPVNKIVPYVNRPVEVIPGVANYYASSFFDSGSGYGIIVKTREGRPIKIEGLPEHPVNGGGLSARAQAHVLNLYDPERFQGPKKNLQNAERKNRDTINISWEDADKEVFAQLKKGKVRILSGTLASPSTNSLLNAFQKAFGGSHVQWDVLGMDAVREGQQACYGQSVVPRYRYNKAKVIVSLGADFLGTFQNSVEATKEFAKGRVPGPLMSRLVVFESLLSLTGMNADTRIPVAPNQLLDAAMGLLHEIIIVGKKSSYAGNRDVASFLEPFQGAANRLGCDPEIFKRLANDLWENRGESLVVAGGLNTHSEDALALQIAANLLNAVLDNDGKTVETKNATNLTYQGSEENLARLIDEMKAGQVNTLIIHRSNPVYALGSHFTEALKKVGMIIYTGDRNDETGMASDLVLPDHHQLESWNDFEFQDGVLSVQQPTIRPMFNTRSFQDSMLIWMGEKRDWLTYLKGQWAGRAGGRSFDDFWVDVLQEGLVDQSNSKRNINSGARPFNLGALRKAKFEPSGKSEGLILYSSIGMGDGSMANVSWLQEFPDPVTKITWGNYLSVSPEYAAQHKLDEGRIVEVEVGKSWVDVPVHIQPGQHSSAFGLKIGYGRIGAGSVAEGSGVNAFVLAEWKNRRLITSNIKVTITPQSRKEELACTQGHHVLEGRNLVPHASLPDYLKNKSAGIHRHKIFSIWDEHKYEGHKWAMVIDSNVCTGCSACVIACQSENNVPAVGKKYVILGREMHWLRIDRYYKGNSNNPETLFQPMLCQHCDNAPCETVCPVVATTHSSEGLNEMIYNRCVGTRYCSNNCPYKVRRFNWFNYVEKDPVKSMAYNPEVTVRSRGVMEKCSFCVQRIKEAKQIAQDNREKLQDGDIKTACQQSCPASAITFGDVNDPGSAVAKLFNAENSSGVLEELNTRPAVKYLTKLRNHLITPKGESNHGGEHHA
ncbi:MAG: molybdopterin oxidoreductase [Proteobacteria bacterium SG_bin7]|nr:MAG: molybdopterin oxidoreductase [Proteobacteria bacterium SG_bin7]